MSSLDLSYSQFRVIMADGATANEDCVMGGPQGVGKLERRRRADPAGMAGGCGDPAVDSLSELQCDKGNACLHEFDEPLVELSAFVFKDPDRCRDPLLV